MKVDFNNLRVQAALTLDALTKSLNDGIMPEREIVLHDVDGKEKEWRGNVLVSTGDIQEQIDTLRIYVMTIAHCFDDADVKDMGDEIDSKGGVAHFNPDNK